MTVNIKNWQELKKPNNLDVKAGVRQLSWPNRSSGATA